jgi:uncharacterized protein (UPF0262 family)
MVFNATFNNISVISWRSVLLVEKTGVNHRQIMLYRVHLTLNEVRTILVVIGTDCIVSCNSYYHAITATTAPKQRDAKGVNQSQ